MAAELRRILESWRPTLFLGFNSLSFDEEFLPPGILLVSLQSIPDEYVRQCPRGRPDSLPHDRGPQTRCPEARDRTTTVAKFSDSSYLLRQMASPHRRRIAPSSTFPQRWHSVSSSRTVHPKYGLSSCDSAKRAQLNPSLPMKTPSWSQRQSAMIIVRGL